MSTAEREMFWRYFLHEDWPISILRCEKSDNLGAQKGVHWTEEGKDIQKKSIILSLHADKFTKSYSSVMTSALHKKTYVDYN